MITGVMMFLLGPSILEHKGMKGKSPLSNSYIILYNPVTDPEQTRSEAVRRCPQMKFELGGHSLQVGMHDDACFEGRSAWTTFLRGPAIACA